jgi:ParB-like nuclease domain
VIGLTTTTTTDNSGQGEGTSMSVGNKRRKLKRVTSTIDLQDLKRLEREGIPAKQQPNGLYLKDIHVAPQVFQWRLANEDILASDQHVRELARVIQSKKPMKPLDPILVIGVGERFFVVEGHHRLDAYHTAGWKGRVAVHYFEGSIEATQIEALKRNIKNQLPVTPRSKSEAAWRLMVYRYKGRKLTWEGIADQTTVHRSTVVRMDRMLKKLGDDVAGLTWIEALQKARAKEAGEHPEGEEAYWDDWREKKARKLADYLFKGPRLLDGEHGITAMALRMVSDALPRELVGHWPEEVMDEIRDWTEDMRPEDTQRVEEALELLDDHLHRRHYLQAPSRYAEPNEDDIPDTAGIIEEDL